MIAGLYVYLPDFLHFEVPMTPRNGDAQANGLSCAELDLGFNNPRGSVRPDFVINRDGPRDARRTGNPSLLVGEFALGINTLVNKYRRGGRQRNQAQAISEHAQNHGIRLAAFFTFFDANFRKKERLQRILFKDFMQDGAIAFVISFGPSR